MTLLVGTLSLYLACNDLTHPLAGLLAGPACGGNGQLRERWLGAGDRD